MRFNVSIELVAGIEAHGTLLASVLLHGVCPEMLVEGCLVIEGLVAILTLERLVQVPREDMRLEVPAKGNMLIIKLHQY